MIGERASFVRIFLSSTFGAICSLGINFVYLPDFWSACVKILCAIVMVLIIQKRYTIKKFCYTLAVFLGFTFVFGGLIFALENFFKTSISPIFVLFAIAIFSFILYMAIKNFYKTKRLLSFVYNLTLEHSGKRENIKAYLDSGNLLTDSSCGLPVIILDYEIFCHLFGVSLVDLLSGKIQDKIKGHYINYASISTQSKIFVCEIDSAYIQNNGEKIPLKAMVGSSYSRHFCADTKALLGPLLL